VQIFFVIGVKMSKGDWLFLGCCVLAVAMVVSVTIIASYNSSLSECSTAAVLLDTNYTFKYFDGCKLEVQDGVYIHDYDIWPWIELKNK
jgi:hypothetical protein